MSISIEVKAQDFYALGESDGNVGYSFINLVRGTWRNHIINAGLSQVDHQGFRAVNRVTQRCRVYRAQERHSAGAGVGCVARIHGDADDVFQQVDIDGNGHVDREELKQLFNLLECYISPGELEEVFNQLDEDKDGTVRCHEAHHSG